MPQHIRAPTTSAAVAVLVATLFPGPARAAAPQAVIFAGGTTEADGRTAQASFEKVRPIFGDGLRLADGYPRVVESRTVPGLKPGFWVVFLGVCADPAKVLEAVRGVYPGAYARELAAEATIKEACPKLGETLPTGLAVAKSKAGTITASAVSTRGVDERGHDISGTTLHFVSISPAGVVLHVASEPGASIDRSGDGPGGWEYEACTAEVKQASGGLRIVRSCTDERTGCNMGERAIPKAWTETKAVTAKASAIEVGSPKTEVTSEEECRADADYGD